MVTKELKEWAEGVIASAGVDTLDKCTALKASLALVEHDHECRARRPIPSYGDLMTIEEMREGYESGCFSSYDGTGYWAWEDAMSFSQLCLWELEPDDEEGRRKIGKYGYTHIVWFNK